MCEDKVIKRICKELLFDMAWEQKSDNCGKCRISFTYIAGNVDEIAYACLLSLLYYYYFLNN